MNSDDDLDDDDALMDQQTEIIVQLGQEKRELEDAYLKLMGEKNLLVDNVNEAKKVMTAQEETIVQLRAKINLLEDVSFSAA
jgi:hypothetical protein